MVALVNDERISIVSLVYERILGGNRKGNAKKFLVEYDDQDGLPEMARSKDFVRQCVIVSFKAKELAWHGKCDMQDPNWVSPVRINEVVDGLLQAGFLIEGDPYPRKARESALEL